MLDHVEIRPYVDKSFFRHDCVEAPGGRFIKDLRLAGRELSKVILIDDSAIAGSRFPDNFLPISRWCGEESDTALLDLLPLLLSMQRVRDVRHILSLRHAIPEMPSNVFVTLASTTANTTPSMKPANFPAAANSTSTTAATCKSNPTGIASNTSFDTAVTNTSTAISRSAVSTRLGRYTSCATVVVTNTLGILVNRSGRIVESSLTGSSSGRVGGGFLETCSSNSANTCIVASAVTSSASSSHTTNGIEPSTIGNIRTSSAILAVSWKDSLMRSKICRLLRSIFSYFATFSRTVAPNPAHPQPTHSRESRKSSAHLSITSSPTALFSSRRQSTHLVKSHNSSSSKSSNICCSNSHGCNINRHNSSSIDSNSSGSTEITSKSSVNTSTISMSNFSSYQIRNTDLLQTVIPSICSSSFRPMNNATNPATASTTSTTNTNPTYNHSLNVSSCSSSSIISTGAISFGTHSPYTSTVSSCSAGTTTTNNTTTIYSSTSNTSTICTRSISNSVSSCVSSNSSGSVYACSNEQATCRRPVVLKAYVHQPESISRNATRNIFRLVNFSPQFLRSTTPSSTRTSTTAPSTKTGSTNSSSLLWYISSAAVVFYAVYLLLQSFVVVNVSSLYELLDSKHAPQREGISAQAGASWE